MKTVFSARLIQRFRNPNPKWYGKLGHRGIDLAFKNEDLVSPITGTVRQIKTVGEQKQMGNCLYLTDAWGNCHVFAHLSRFLVRAGDHVVRGQKIALTGNTGTITSGPHLHYEIVCVKPYRNEDRPMLRKLPGVTGYNTDPIPYLRDLYAKYGVVVQ